MFLVLALLLPLIAWLGCYLLCRELAARQRIQPDWQLSWVLASVAWGALLTLIVEASGAVHQFTAPVVGVAWIVSGAGLVGLARRLAARRRAQGAGAAGAVAAGAGAAARGRGLDGRGRWRTSWRQAPLDARLFLIGAVVIIAALGVIAVTTACTNYDALSYHLTRVVHWVDQRSVAHYATDDWRQVEFGPWAEFGIANFYLLEGSDWLANSVQWFAMLTSVIAATLLARQLLPGWRARSGAAGAAAAASDASPDAGASLRWRSGALTALLVASIPIGITESVTAQNDYVVACWFVCAVCLAVALYYDPPNPWYTAGLGGALGVGFLTKSTMALFIAPFVGLLIPFLLVRLPGYRLRARLLLVLAITFAAINAPHMARNYALYRSPLGSNEAMLLLRTKSITVSGTASNVIRNLALYTGTGVEAWTKAINDFVPLVHGITGRGLSDPDVTFIYTPFQLPDTFLVGDSGANSIYHVALIGIVLALLIVRRVPHKATLAAYGGLVAASFVLFCAMLRWQPWHCRFHIGYFILLMPLAAIVLVTTLPRWLTAAIACGFMVLGTVCVIIDETRPLNPYGDFIHWTHEQQYFLARPTAYESYRNVADDIVASGCKDVGLHITMNQWEYPVWVFLRNRGFDGRLFNVGIYNTSARRASAHPTPCAMITATPTPPKSLIAILPVQQQYGFLDVRWAEPASHWVRLTRATPDGEVVVSGHEWDLPFDGSQTILTLRTREPGTLALQAIATHAASGARDAVRLRWGVDNAIKIVTSAGYAETRSLAVQPVTLPIHMPAGGTTITITLDRPVPDATFFQNLTWTWKADSAKPTTPLAH